MNATIGWNTHADAAAIASTNASLADDVRLPDAVIATILLDAAQVAIRRHRWRLALISTSPIHFGQPTVRPPASVGRAY